MTPPSAIPEATLLRELAEKGVHRVEAFYEGLGDRHECVHLGFLDAGGHLMGDPLALLPDNLTARLLILLEDSLPQRFGFEPDGADCRLTLSLPAGQARFTYREKRVSYVEVQIQGGPLGRPGVPAWPLPTSLDSSQESNCQTRKNRASTICVPFRSHPSELHSLARAQGAGLYLL